MAAGQRETGFEMIEMGSTLLGAGTRRDKRCGRNAEA
jgi:hypothetical protein